MKLRKLKEHVLCAAIVYGLCGSCSSKKKPNDSNPHFLGQGGMVHTSNSNATQNPRLRQLGKRDLNDLTHIEIERMFHEIESLISGLDDAIKPYYEDNRLGLICRDKLKDLSTNREVVSMLTRLVNTDLVCKRYLQIIFNRSDGDISEGDIKGLLGNFVEGIHSDAIDPSCFFRDIGNKIEMAVEKNRLRKPIKINE